MIAYYPFSGMRLTVSAVFSIAVHALVMVLLTGAMLFPQAVSNPVRQLEITLALNPQEQSKMDALLEADKHQAGEKIAKRPSKQSSPLQKQTRQQQSVKTQGNAQWTAAPQAKQETSWQNILDQRAKHRTVSAATHEARDAAYLARWRDRVEQFGTQYYQEKIKEKPLAGEVRILVAIGSKGQLLDAQIRESSGKPALDAIAIEILRQSAPFEALPAEISSDTDVLEIIRTWKFSVHEGLRTG